MEKDFSKRQISTKKKKLDKLKENLRVKLDNNSQEKLEIFLEAWLTLKRGSFWFIRKLIDKLRKELEDKLGKEEIKKVCRIQDELSKLILTVKYPNPKRGEIYWTVFDGENVGTEINGKKRLSLIISNNWYNEEYTRVTVLPITSKTNKIYPFEVKIGKLVEEEESKILIDQVKSFDKWRLSKLVFVIPDKLMAEVEEKLEDFLSLKDNEKELDFLFFNKY